LIFRRIKFQAQQKKKMMKKSSSEPCCSKECRKNTESLNNKIKDLKSKLSESDIYGYSYKLGVGQLEGRLAGYKEREVKYIEKIRTLEMDKEYNLRKINKLTNEVETLKEEKDVVDGKVARLLKSSKDLEDIIESQRPSPTVESTSAEGQNKNSTTAENGESTDSILSKPAVKFVKAGDRPAERPTTNKAEFVKAAERPTIDKVETAKKPVVRYADMYRRSSKRSYGAPMRPSHEPASHRPHGPPMRPMRSNMNDTRPRTSAVRPQYRAPWVHTVNRNFPPVNRKVPTGTIFGFPPYPFNYPTRRLTIEEMLAKFIDEGKCEHEEMEIFVKYFRITNELLLKEGSHLLSELEIKVNELSNVMGNVLVPKNEVKGVTTRGGKMTSSNEINETRITKNEPPRFEQDVQEKPHDDGVENKSSSIPEKTTQPLTFEKRKRFFSQVKTYFSEEPYAFKLCMDNIMRRCVAGSETLKILAHCHSGPTGGHHSANVTTKKVYEPRFYWPSVFKDTNVDYVSKWVKAQALPTNDARVVVKFLRQLFARFGVPKALISDRGTHFCNFQLEKALQRYDVTHKLSMAYHSQSNGQTEVTNRAIKRILERSVGYNPKGWSKKLNDALWAFRTA
nr:hypothetical protein [Tanacetum cinerariifolium]